MCLVAVLQRYPSFDVVVDAVGGDGTQSAKKVEHVMYSCTEVTRSWSMLLQ